MAVTPILLKSLVCLSLLRACCGVLGRAGDGNRVALIVIDVQNCFVPGGENPVPDGDDVIPVINDLRQTYQDNFDLVVMSQDWHCPDHVSFASQHPGYSNYDVMQLDYDAQGHLCTGPSPYAVNCTDNNIAHRLNQTLWPDHCVINSTGAEFNPRLDTKTSDLIVQKGYRCEVDSYSAFFDNGGFRQTELDSLLKQNQIDTLVITGLALDFCVFFTAMDGQKLGYDTYVVEEATRGITNEGISRALTEMAAAGVSVIPAQDVGKVPGVASGSVLPSVAIQSVVLATFIATLSTYAR